MRKADGGFGFHPAFTKLTRRLYEPDVVPIEKLFRAVPAGADTEVIVRTWIAWVWRANPSLRKEVTDLGARRHCQAIIAMHDRASKGEAISRRAWREARTHLAVLGSTTDPQGRAIETVVSCAWDLTSIPDAAAEVYTAWQSAVLARLDRQIGWTKTDKANFHAHIDRCFVIAQQQVGPAPPESASPDWAKSGAAKAYSKAVMTAYRRLLPAHSNEMSDRAQTRSALRVKAIKALRRRAQDGLALVVGN